MADSKTTQSRFEKNTISQSNGSSSSALATQASSIEAHLSPEQATSQSRTTQCSQDQQQQPNHLQPQTQSRSYPPTQDSTTPCSNPQETNPSLPQGTPDRDQPQQQPQAQSPMSFNTQLDTQPDLLHLRGGCDDECCDFCCCAYTRQGPAPQPLIHRMWYGAPDAK